MAAPSSGYQPRNTPAERRAFFDITRRLGEIKGTADDAVTDDELAAALSPTPVAVNLASSFVPYGGGYRAPVSQRIGNVVHLSGLAKYTAATATLSALAVGTLPVGHRPSATIMIASMVYSTASGQYGSAHRLNVQIDGAMTVYPTGTVAESMTQNVSWVSITGSFII